MIYLGGYPAIDNLGDVALFQSYQKQFSDKNLIHYQGSKLLFKLFKRIGNGTPAIAAGGTLINRLSFEAIDQGSQIFNPFYVMGTGVAQKDFWQNVEGWQDRIDDWCRVLERAEYIGVRGPLSQKSLIDNGLRNVKVVGDPVMIFAYDQEDKLQNHQKTIGINIGVSLTHVWGSEEEIYKKYVDIVRKLKSDSWRISWYVVCPEDLPITLQIAKETNTEDTIHQIFRDVKHYMKTVNNESVFIGMKLHAVVLAITQQVPSIMIEYRPKCRDFMQSISQENRCFRSDAIDPEMIIEVCQNLLD